MEVPKVHTPHTRSQFIHLVNFSYKMQQRATAKPLFRAESIKEMLPVFLDGGKVVVEQLGETASRGDKIDMQNLFMVSCVYVVSHNN